MQGVLPVQTISEKEFRERLEEKLTGLRGKYKSVSGPGRSGAIASVYASHFLRVPWVPCVKIVAKELQPVLVIDTAMETGKTLKKAVRRVGTPAPPCYVYFEPPRVKFWYEKSASGQEGQ